LGGGINKKDKDMPSIDTLIKDMEDTILGLKGWDHLISLGMGERIGKAATSRFRAPQKPRGYLSFSSIGSPCKRKLWYKINETATAKPLAPSDLLKFFYGDMIEELALTIAMAAGHDVKGQQDRLNVHGIKGHRDAVIDGMTIDVKSCSPYAFKKFKEGNLRQDDPFGYISQLSSYVYAGQDDDKVTDKTHGAFLAIDKQNGHMCLDVYDFTEELRTKEQEMLEAKELVAGDMPDQRQNKVPQSKSSPNSKLPMMCSYCEFKKQCWPEARKFIYSTGPVYLVDVRSEPKVPEVSMDED
jgi:CRISPR/Cas system-associated exonuclease Cas4 (RecB family)